MVNNKRSYALVIFLSIILALLVEIFVFMSGTDLKFEGIPVPLIGQQYQISIVGYEVFGNNSYVAITDDPQIIISNINQSVEYIAIEFFDHVKDGTTVEVFYVSKGESFTQEHSSLASLGEDSSSGVVIQIPETLCESLRIDINGSFSLKQIYATNEPVLFQSGLVNSFSILRFFIMAICAFVAMIVLFYWWNYPKTAITLKKIELIFCIGIFLYYFAWTIVQPYNYAPDEAMRYDVTEFLYQYNRLPRNDELLSIWGFSYAHLPTVLCNELGYVFMKIASIFKKSYFFLLIAARTVSVCCATGAVYFVIKITKRLFNSSTRWIAIVMFAFMPQYSFLASYVNSDIVAIFGISMITYSWIFAIQDDWNIKNGILLSLGISVCALSYYNSYAWILFSIVMVTCTYLHKHKGDYKGFIKLSLCMCTIVLLLICYNFARHIILYNDLLGFQTSQYYAEIYAIDSLKPSLKLSLKEQGVAFGDMFTQPYNWFYVTYMSFIGFFGYMQYRCPEFVYEMVFVFFIVGVIGLLIRSLEFIHKKEKPKFEITMFYISMVICSIITVGLSIYNSYFSDFQPQGRYCYPMFIAFVVFITKGYETLVLKIKQKEYLYAMISSICVAWIIGAIFIYQMIYLPSLHL